MQLTRWLDVAKADKNGDAPIVFIVCWNYNRIRVFSGEKVMPKHWSANKRSVKGIAPFANEIERALDKVETAIRTAWYELSIEQQPDKGDLQAKIKSLIKPQVVKIKSLTLSDFFDKYMADFTSRLGHNYIRKFKPVKDAIVRFNPTLKLTDLDTARLNNYVGFLNSENKSSGTVGSHIKCIKAVVAYAIDCKEPTAVNALKFKVKSINGNKINLTWAEVEMLLNLNLIEDRLNAVRVKFLFNIFTGLRYSDFSALTASNIDIQDEYRVLKFVQQKTKEYTVIPINDYAEQLLSQHQDLIFKALSSQNYNSYLKEVCREAGIVSSVNQTTFKGGKRQDEIKKKYELITSHTARHTHGVLSVERGLHARIIQDNLGHESLSSTQVYTKIEDKERFKATLKAWSSKVAN
jgi:site-specific recombinase XerD